MTEVTLKEGYLVKAPDVAKNLHNFKKWQRKWFQLKTNGDLYYYDNDKVYNCAVEPQTVDLFKPSASKPVGVIHLLQCHRLFDGKSRGVQTSYCCGMDVGDVTYYLKAESARSFSDWVKPMSEFAEVCEITLDVTEERRGTLTTEDVGERGGRSGSVQSRHFSVTTKAKFLSKEGWLAKTGSNNKGWKDRYFKLHNGKLFYHKNDKTESPLGDIDLFLCTSVEKTAGKKGYGFDVLVPGRVYNLSTESEVDQTSWMSTISDTLTHVTDIKESTSNSLFRSGSTSSNVSSASVSSSTKDLATSTQVRTQNVGSSDGGAVSSERAQLKHQTSDRGFEESMCISFDPSALLATKEESKDSVVQLLEAEVEALRNKVTSVEADLKASTAVNSQIQQQLSEVKRSHFIQERELGEELEHLSAQVTQLERSKHELETINDSVRTQLEEQLERVQELEEDLLVTRHELDESQTTNTAVEEELSETQQKLQEIDLVARELESALRKRGESEPATPLTASLRSLGWPHPIHTDTEESTSEQVIVEAAAKKLEDRESPDSKSVGDLRQELSMLMKEKQDLNEQLTSLHEQNHKPVLSETTETTDSSSEIEEEKLKWQMEMENLRRELNTSFESQRNKLNSEKSVVEKELSVLREKVARLESGSQDKVTELERKLSEAETRVTQLEGDIDTHKEKVSQLQVQKEKALTDLIAIRKTNKSMEKRMSETEDSRVPSPMNSLTHTTSLPDTPEVGQKVSELEKKIEELKASLLKVEKERDILKAKLDRLTSGIQSTPDFQFKNKSVASVARSNITTAAENGSLVSTESTHSLPSTTDAPPPKPKRPPKDLINKFQQSDEIQSLPKTDQGTRLRSRTATLLKSLFPLR